MAASKHHCYYCFDTIAGRLFQNQPKEIGFEDGEFPLFVTWKKSNYLRGCIGTFSSLPLRIGLRKYANLSAFDDSRFAPIVEDELPELTCSVSLLHSFEETSDYLNWEIGIHGLDLSYKHYSSTYLPNIALEQGWDKMETLTNLLKKAGYKGRVNEQVLRNLELFRYQSAVAEASYSDYIANC